MAVGAEGLSSLMLPSNLLVSFSMNVEIEAHLTIIRRRNQLSRGFPPSRDDIIYMLHKPCRRQTRLNNGGSGRPSVPLFAALSSVNRRRTSLCCWAAEQGLPEAEPNCEAGDW
eukprot:6202992-Pleurochrysis_carterae.AAC.1